MFIVSYASEANTSGRRLKALLEARVEGEPDRVVARGIEGKHRSRGLPPRRRAFAQQGVAQHAETAEDALLHPGCAHLLHDESRPARRRPRSRCASAPDSSMMRSARVKSVAPGMYFCSISTGWPSRRDGVLELEDAEAAVAVVDAQQRDLLQSEVGVDPARERVALHAIVLNGGEIPGNDGFGNRGVGGGAVDDRHFGFQRDAQRDVGGIGADRAQHRPDFVVVGHLDDFVAGCSPDRLIVVDHQPERFAAIAARGVGLFDGELCAVQHQACRAFRRDGFRPGRESRSAPRRRLAA